MNNSKYPFTFLVEGVDYEFTATSINFKDRVVICEFTGMGYCQFNFDEVEFTTNKNYKLLDEKVKELFYLVSNIDAGQLVDVINNEKENSELYELFSSVFGDFLNNFS